jgi:UDP-N-acetylglucosamine 2-epimerase (non-hydrolysing)
MKILTVFGTRPEIIRLSAVIRHLDRATEHILVHTGQNYDELLSDIFFQELNVRQPDRHLGVRSSGFADQVARIIAAAGSLLEEVRPDRVLILGDTNSGLVSIVAARMGIPVYHMEAGNRCYDDRVPEEINRRLIDHTSTVLMPYTHRSKENLVREGIPRERIYVIGNPIFEVLEEQRSRIDASTALERLGAESGKYFLATLHRAENVDVQQRLQSLIAALDQVASIYDQDVIVSIHPRTADTLTRFGVSPRSPRVRMSPPMGFFDFVHLERHARAVLSDSGTVQEECCIFGIPTVTLRDVTERPETIECGSNVISGVRPDDILRAVRIAMQMPTDWTPPAEYRERHVSVAVAKIVTGQAPV